MELRTEVALLVERRALRTQAVVQDVSDALLAISDIRGARPGFTGRRVCCDVPYRVGCPGTPHRTCVTAGVRGWLAGSSPGLPQVILQGIGHFLIGSCEHLTALYCSVKGVCLLCLHENHFL